MIYIKMSGGLGNQMFQYAAAKWVQKLSGQSLCLDYSDFDNYKLNHNATFANTLGKFNIKYNKVISDKNLFFQSCTVSREYEKIYRWLMLVSFLLQFEGRMGIERMLQYKLNKKGLIFARDGYIPIYPEIIGSSDIVISGFLQSTKYFPHMQEELRNDFQLIESISKENTAWIDEISTCESVCFHVRRGDYTVKNRTHCTLHYYKMCLEKVIEKVESPCFFVFSDDLNWVKTNIDLEGLNVTYVDSKNDSCNELNIMKYCKHFIISNSTFSWWAQYLSENSGKIVIAPRPWLRRIPSDIYMENWITIPVYE